MPECPYKGLEPYQEEDSARFFGRDHDIRLASENLCAARLTVLCGESGTGKSSLLRAGVAARLNHPARGGDDFRAVVYQIGRGDPAEGMAIAVRAAVGLDAPGLNETGADLTQCADHLTQCGGDDLLVILDQFEDYFAYHPTDTAFVKELARLLGSREAPVNFMLGIRDDALAQLAHLKNRIPGVLDNVLRIEHLDKQAALEAMLRPLEGTGVKLDPALAEEVCGEIICAQGGGRERVPAPFLQLVMTRWWDEDHATGELTAATLRTRLGGVTKVFQTHFANSMQKLSRRERRAAVNIFGPMVTSGGRKIAQTVSELSAGGGERASEVRTVLGKLRREHILTVVPTPPHFAEDDTCYEFAHDVLAKEAFEWRRRRAHAKARGIVCMLGAIVGALVGTLLLTNWALSERKEAIAERRAVRQRELALQAEGRLSSDPELAALIASYAVAEAGLVSGGAEEAKAALHRALQSCPLYSLSFPEGRVNAVALSPNGKLLAAASDVGMVRIRDLENGDEWRKLAGHQGSVNAVVFSPDGLKVLTGGEDRTARIWDAAAGAEIRRLDAGGPIRALAFSPDGAKVAAAGDEGTLALWDRATGELTAKLKGHKGAVRAVAFEPLGLRLTTAGDDQTVRVWDAATGRQLRSSSADARDVRRIVFSPDSRWLAAGRGDGSVLLWEPNEAAAPQVLRGHTREVTAVSFSPDARRLATADADGAVRLWDVASRTVSLRLEGYPGVAVRALACGSGGMGVATGSSDGAVRIWAEAPMEVARLHGGEWPLALTFSPNGAYLAASSGRTVNLWETNKWSVRQIAGHEGNIHGLAFSPDSRRLATASDDRTARLWDALTGVEQQSLPHDSEVYSVTFPGNDRIATVGVDGTLLLWDTAGHKLAPPRVAAGQVGLMAFSARGERLVTIREHDLAIAEVHPPRDVRQIPIDPGSLLSLAVSPDGTWIAAGLFDGTLKVFNAATGEQSAMGSPGKALFGVAFSSDGRQLATGAEDRTVRIWERNSKKELLALRFHDSPVERVAFSPNGGYLASSDTDGVVHVYAYDETTLLSLARKRLGGRTLSARNCVTYLNMNTCPPPPWPKPRN